MCGAISLSATMVFILSFPGRSVHIQFIKYPMREMYFALYEPAIGGNEGRRGSDYLGFLERVSEDLIGVDRERIRYAFNSHFPREDRQIAIEALMLEERLEVRDPAAPLAKVLQFRPRDYPT